MKSYINNDKKKGKLQSWSLSFTTYLNLVPNLLIVSIWSLTFLVLCQFSACRYLFDGKKMTCQME